MAHHRLLSSIALLPFLFFYLRKQLLIAIITSILILGGQNVITQCLFHTYNVKKAYSNDLVEMISIPLQQVSRVIYENGMISAEDTHLLAQIVNVDEVKHTYKPYISDPIKVLIRQHNNKEYLEAHKLEFLQLWIRLGIKNPGKYTKAYIDQTKGFWYPDVQQSVLMTKSAHKQKDLNFQTTPLLGKKISNIFHRVNFAYLDIPIVGNLYSIATYVWITWIAIGFTLSKKKNILPILPSIFLWGSLMVTTPVAHEFRYAYPIVITTPLAILIMIDSFRRESNDSRIPTASEQGHSENTI